MLDQKYSVCLPRCVHIKVRFKYRYIVTSNENHLYPFPCLCNRKKGKSKKANVCVLVLAPFTYVIFYGNNGYATVNVTGIKQVESINACFATYCSYINNCGMYNDFMTNPKIDNMTYTGRINTSTSHLDLFSLYHHALKDGSDFNAHLNPLHLNNLVLQEKEKRGTYLLYKSGRYSLVGVKHQGDIRWIHKKLLVLIRTSML